MTPFGVKDIAHALFVRDIVNCMGSYKLPYNERTYELLVHEFIKEHNKGNDKKNNHLLCYGHKETDDGCDLEDVTEWVLRKAQMHEVVVINGVELS